MCKLLGLMKLQIMPHQPKMNGLVERYHQTIMWMIGKLGEDKKADWSHHLTAIVHAYNATWSAVMGYIPHYLMFEQRPRLPVNFYFPTFRTAEVPRWGTSTWCVDEYVATVQDHLRATPQEAQAQSMAEVQRQKWYYDQKIGAIGLKSGDLVLLRADAFQGKRKIKNRLEDKPHEVVCQIVTDIFAYEVKDQHGHSHILHSNWVLLFASEAGVPICSGVTKYRMDVPDPPQSSLLLGEVTDTTPQEDSGLVITQHQARKSTLGWINGKLRLLPWTSTGVSTDDRWIFQVVCSRHGEWVLMSFFEEMAGRLTCVWWRDGHQPIDAKG